ncbi:rRNA N(6)-adenosine-methyltransferase ZCCHC4-like isoform X2 [Oculina patagonica]
MQCWHAAEERLGVDVCLTEKNLESAPECPHGPMLLFRRFYKDGRLPQKFYACSAARDRKDCSFFQWEGEKVSEARSKAHKEIVKASREPFIQTCERYKNIFHAPGDLKMKKCYFCHSCGLLFLPEGKEKHQAHDYEQAGDLSKPTAILRPRENEKTQAQYLFSRKATEFLVSMLKDLGFKNVLCVGTPRIHEEIQASVKTPGSLDSLLLDIDFRYAQFFPTSSFCWYNMFNHFFFGNHASRELFNSFLRRDDLVLVMDPPFGGLAEVLSVSIKKIWEVWRQSLLDDETDKELPTIWIFPYFLEPQIKAVLPSLAMLDYKVDYENHPHFKGKNMKGSKRGSPVRIFTNINPADVVLPSAEGYRFCKSCRRYVAPENVHCKKCGGCMSKDGRQYVHCDMCGTCVKPGRQHCMTCDRCETEGHQCNRSGIDTAACHICGGLGHKRRNCPNSPLVSSKKRIHKHSDGTRIDYKKKKQKAQGAQRNKQKIKKTA